MSGHSKWAQIKHKKGAIDAKRGKIFSKLSLAISVAARDGADPNANPRLRTAIEKAKANQVPNENIERALKRALDSKNSIEQVAVEAYGPEGAALFVLGVTDNTNRFMGEIRILFKDYDAKVGEPGSVMWAFDKVEDEYKAKYDHSVSESARGKLARLIEALEERDDIQGVWTNVPLQQQ